MKILLPLAAIAAGFLATPSAYAEDASTRIVRVSDLRLDTAEGVAKFDRRLAIAAKNACASVVDFDRAGRRAAKTCQVDTIAAFTPQRDTLIASAQAKHGVELSAR
jgi:UrcA family protein